MDIFKKLTFPDYLSLTGLAFSWISIVFLITGDPLRAIIFSAGGAFGFDVLDGYFARMLKSGSGYGKLLDSFIDILTYLVFSAILVVKYISPSIFIGLPAGFIILIFGLLRLVRFTQDGLTMVGKSVYYTGFPVYHIYFVTIIGYFLVRLFSGTANLPVLIAITISAPFMVTSIRYKKLRNPFLILVLIISIIIVCCSLGK
jgi:phosphatidylserine synthase